MIVGGGGLLIKCNLLWRSVQLCFCCVLSSRSCSYQIRDIFLLLVLHLFYYLLSPPSPVVQHRTPVKILPAD